MDIIALFLGAFIGLIGWSTLTRFSYAIHDVTHKTNLVTKLGEPNGRALFKTMLWWVAGASVVWLVAFGAACLHFVHSDSSQQFLAWFFGGATTTPVFIAYTTTRAAHRIYKRKVERAQL